MGFFFLLSDLRQELAVRERQQEVTRKSAPSSPTLDCEKMDSAVQASLSLPATPVGKGSENSFPSPKGTIHRDGAWLCSLGNLRWMWECGSHISMRCV